jgi:hypothetical protein
VNYGETTASKRRIAIYLVDSDGEPVTGLTPTGSEVQVSASGEAFTNAAGVVTEIGDGAYYYQATEAESETLAYLLLKVVDAGLVAEPFVLATEIEINGVVRLLVDEADLTRRRAPIYLTDDSGDAVPALDLDGVIEVSVDGAAFGAAAGTWVETGSGAYYYIPDDAEITTQGICIIKVAHGDARTYVYTFDVIDEYSPATSDCGNYFGNFFGSCEESEEVDTGPEPVEAEVTEASVEYTDHVLAAVDRLPEYARAKVSDS